jgi:hypothetical protein
VVARRWIFTGADFPEERKPGADRLSTFKILAAEEAVPALYEIISLGVEDIIASRSLSS